MRAGNALALVVAACNPATTRPDFRPFPETRSVVVMARRERVIPFLATLVAAESLRVKQASPVDGYLETDWYDTRTHRSFGDGHYVPDLAGTVKLRCWVDPYVPSESMLTIEAVYRPRVDPSRPERDLEAAVSPDHAGYKLAQALVDSATHRFGSTTTAP